MAKRNNNHIIGDTAVREISASLIPQEWIINTQVSDYGLDMLVEIVKDDETTGKMFFIQAKGTDTPSNNGTIHFHFPIERLKDYRKVSLPVLLIVYNRHEERFWGKWVNKLFDLLSSKQQERQSYSIKLSPQNIVDQDYFRSFSDLLSEISPNGICIRAHCPNHKTSRFHKQILKKAESLFSSSIADNNRLSCNNCHIEYSYTQGKLDVSILNDYGHRFHFTGILEDEAFLYYDTLSDEDCPAIMWDILCSIAYLQRAINWDETFAIITEHITPTFLSSLSDTDWLSFFQPTPKESLVMLKRFLEICIEQKRQELISLLLVSIFTTSNGDYSLIRHFLLKVYASEPDLEKKGLLAYNIANSLRTYSLDAMYDAALWYFTAIRSFPTYRKLEYWWQEMGSILYNTGHFFLAECFYKKARTISKERCYPSINVLIAECLVKQLKLEDARKEIYDHIDEKKRCGADVNSSFILKAKAITLFHKIKPTISFDPLSTIEWYNHGVCLSEQFKYKEALSCFLIAWLLNDQDKESLLNVLITSWNINEPSIICDALWSMKELYGEDGYNYIVSFFLKQEKIPEQSRERFIDGLHELMFDYKVPRLESHNLAPFFDGWSTDTLR